MHRGMQILIFAAMAVSFPLFVSCPNPLMNAVKEKVAADEGKSIGSFGFAMANNPKLYTDLSGAVDEAARTIPVVVPKWVPLTNLVATFQFRGAAVTINGLAQTSGVTANDFSMPVTYTVTPTVGTPVQYTVTATTGARGLMGGSIQGVPLSLTGTVDTVAGQASIFGDPAACVYVDPYLYVADFAYHVIWRIQNSNPYTATVFAGAIGDPQYLDAPSGPATAARFSNPWGLASDGTNLYVADYSNAAIRKIEIATGKVTTLTGGTYGSVDGAPGVAQFAGPVGLFYYAAGSVLYETDADVGAVRTIDLSGNVTTLVTNQPTGYEYPVAIVRDGSYLYVADQGVNAIWQINAASPYTVSPYASTGSDINGGWNNGSGSGAQFYLPSALAVSGSYLYVADYGNNEIRRITIPTSPLVSTFIGSHTQPGSNDGLGSAILLYSPQGLCISGSTLFFAETGNKLVRKVQLTLTTSSPMAGTPPGSANGVGSAARFFVPRLLTTNGSSVWIVDGFNHLIRSLDPVTRSVGTLAGVLQPGSVIDEADGAAASALFSYPSGAVQVGSQVFICDNVGNTIRKLDLNTGQVTTFAGTKYTTGYSDGTGQSAEFNGPTSITSDGTYLYITDFNNQTIRRIEIATRVVTTIAGFQGAQGDTDDLVATGGVAANARFRFPFGITTDGTNLFITDRTNNKIRKLEIATGKLSTFVGPVPGIRSPGYVNATGNAARFSRPRGITTDGTYLYVADSLHHVIRRISIATAVVDPVAGPAAPNIKAGEADGSGDAARFNNPNGITTDGVSLFVSDIGGNTIRRVR